jgi:hypothetical protein
MSSMSLLQLRLQPSREKLGRGTLKHPNVDLPYICSCFCPRAQEGLSLPREVRMIAIGERSYSKGKMEGALRQKDTVCLTSSLNWLYELTYYCRPAITILYFHPREKPDMGARYGLQARRTQSEAMEYLENAWRILNIQTHMWLYIRNMLAGRRWTQTLSTFRTTTRAWSSLARLWILEATTETKAKSSAPL